MSWLFGRRCLQATREKIEANWGVGFIEDFTKSLKLRQTQIEYISKLEKVVEAARKLKPKQPSEVKVGEFLVEGWPDLILALKDLDGKK